uniref:(northern house mosquito) hypothetical protein n=1 Tax=Culex pipiens TaxID=7175 RepID=A0A8D8L7T9_CULPI
MRCGDQVGGAFVAGHGYLGYFNGGPLFILLVEALNQIALKVAARRVPLVFLRLKLFHQLAGVQQGNYFKILFRPRLAPRHLPILLTTVGQRRARVRLDRFDDHGGNLPPGRTRGWILQDQLGDLHRGPLLAGRSGRVVVKHVRATFADYLNGTLPYRHILQRVYRKGSRITATLLRQRVTFRVSHLAIQYLRLQVIASSMAHLLRTNEC